MKLMINTVNLKVGGAFQRAVSFLIELQKFGKDEYFVLLNNEISSHLDLKSYPENFKFYFFKHSPASFKHRRSVVTEFNRLESALKPNVVFSFVGPSYWKPECHHLVGFGIPHIVYDDYKYVKNYSWKVKLEMFYKKYWTKKEANFYVVQTEDVRERLSEKIGVDISKVFLVSNGIGNQFNNMTPRINKNKNVKKLLMISTYRPSKNFEIINEVVHLLRDDIYDYEFHLTIKNEDYQRIFSGNEKWVKNHGHVSPGDCPSLYNECDAMFLPSHLECFSASYPEAMKMHLPILTSNLSFATTVCENSALYFDNLSATDIANKIKNLFHNEDLYRDLVDKGVLRLSSFDTSRQQAEKYIDICKGLFNGIH